MFEFSQLIFMHLCVFWAVFVRCGQILCLPSPNTDKQSIDCPIGMCNAVHLTENRVKTEGAGVPRDQ